MATILFGGGDGGGLIITANGVRRIPPFDPAIFKQLRATALLTNAYSPKASADTRRELQALATKAANLVVGQVEADIGPLGSDAMLIYDDDDGGFYCGSTGKPPIPIPSPRELPAVVRNLLSSGDVRSDLIDFGDKLRDSGTSLSVALEDPQAAAKAIGVPLSDATTKALRAIAPSRLKEVKDRTDKEVLTLFHKVLDDGRYVDSWTIRPEETARQLDVKLSKAALDRIVAVSNNPIGDPAGPVSNPVAIAVVVGVVIMLVPTEAGRSRLNVRDLSAIRKF